MVITGKEGIVANRVSIQPAAFAPVGGFKRFDRRQILACTLDIVEPLEQAFFAHGVDFEMMNHAFGVGHRLRRQIDRQLRADPRLQLAPYRGGGRLVQHQRQQAVFAPLLVKISPKLGAITQRIPNSYSA